MSKTFLSRLLWQLERSGLGSVKRERRGKDVYFSLERPESFPAIRFNAKALNELALCRGFLMNVLPFSMQRGEPFSVRVRFSIRSADYAAERQWSEGQRVERHEDGSVTIEARMCNIPECISWVLGFRVEAELLEPERLREEIKSPLLKMRRLYMPGRRKRRGE